jgi:L-lactate permease
MAATVAFIIAFFNTNYLLSIITSITVLGISIPLLRNWDSKGKSAKSNRISSIADRLVETIPSNLDNKSDSIEIEVANVYGTSVQTDDSDSIKVNKRQRS